MTSLGDIELVPDELRAHVYAHEIGPAGNRIPCWSIVSDGLKARGQKEVVFSITRSGSDSPSEYPQDPLHLLTLISALAGEGKLVDVGGLTGLSNGQLGRNDLTGVVYGHQDPFDEIPLPADCIAGIFVTTDELEVAMHAGAGRILARLARLHGWFPNPPFTDRTRRPVAVPGEMSASVLAVTPQGRLRGRTTIGLDGDCLSLSLPALDPSDLQALEQVPLDRQIAYVADPASGSRPRLVWEVGQQQREAIGAPGADLSRVTGHFVALTPDRHGNEVVFVEDGFGVILKPRAYEAVRRCIQAGEPFMAKRRRGDYDFSLLPPSVYAGASGQRYVGHWARYSPAPTELPDPPPQQPVAMTGVVLLTPEEHIERSVPASDLAAYARSIHSTAQRFFSERPKMPGQDLRVHARLEHSASPTLQLDVRGTPGSSDIDSEAMQSLVDMLGAASAPQVSGAPVEFDVLLTIWGGSGLPFPGPQLES